MTGQRPSNVFRLSIIASAAFAGVLAVAIDVKAQALKDVQIADKPLTLKAQGSFFVGGDKVNSKENWAVGARGHITINQMYVRFMVPDDGDGTSPW